MPVNDRKLDLRMCPVGPWPVNSYVLICPATGQSVLLDPGADPQALLAVLADTHPIAILLTHTHPDHVGALDEMRARLRVPVIAHPGPHHEGLALVLDRSLGHADRVQVGEHALRVYHTPGHLPDMLCFALENDRRVIVGDAVFEGGPGKTWSPEDFQTTLRSLRDVILGWPDDMLCYPGHGDPFRLGDQRAAIESFLSKDHGDFYGDATWDS